MVARSMMLALFVSLTAAAAATDVTVATDACTSSPCRNGGSCYATDERDDGFVCKCPRCYAGTLCESSTYCPTAQRQREHERTRAASMRSQRLTGRFFAAIVVGAVLSAGLGTGVALDWLCGQKVPTRRLAKPCSPCYSPTSVAVVPFAGSKKSPSAPERKDTPWDEFEMMRHGLVDRHCRHKGVADPSLSKSPVSRSADDCQSDATQQSTTSVSVTPQQSASSACTPGLTTPTCGHSESFKSVSAESSMDATQPDERDNDPPTHAAAAEHKLD